MGFVLSFLFILVLSILLPLVLYLLFRKAGKKIAYVFLGLVLILSIFQIAVFILAGNSDQKIYKRLSGMWTENRLSFKQSAPDFNIISLSYYCQGLEKYSKRHPEKKEEVLALMENIIDTAMSPAWNPYHASLGLKFMGNHGLYLSHISSMMSAYTRLSGDQKYFNYNTLIYAHIMRILFYSKDYHLQSYPAPSLKWPADNAVIYRALHEYGSLYPVANHLPYEQAWLKILQRRYTDTNTGLPASEITGRTQYSAYPRGCANAWLVYYLAGLDQGLARQYWQHYKKYYKRKGLLFSAFREYPPGVDLPADSDSGPIILGYGTSASALSVPAARRMGDYLSWWQLRYSQAVVACVSRILSWAGIDAMEQIWQSPLSLTIRFIF